VWLVTYQGDLYGREATKINLTTKRRKVLYGQVPAHDALCASFGHILSVLKQKVCKEFNFFLASPKRNKKRRQRLYISTKLSAQYPLALRQSSKIQHCSCEFSAELGLRWCGVECILSPPQKTIIKQICKPQISQTYCAAIVRAVMFYCCRAVTEMR